MVHQFTPTPPETPYLTLIGYDYIWEYMSKFSLRGLPYVVRYDLFLKTLVVVLLLTVNDVNSNTTPRETRINGKYYANIRIITRIFYHFLTKNS